MHAKFCLRCHRHIFPQIIHEINPTPPPPQNKKHSRTRFVSLTHTHVGGGRARREEVHARRTYSRLFPNHTRAGTRWSSFLYEKGSPRGNLARVLVVHLVEGGSSTTGEQTNCDLTRYVKLKKVANHVGPTLEARLYTLEYFRCVSSTRRTKRSLLSMPSPPPTGEVARRMR